jgi:hypothetical protein
MTQSHIVMDNASSHKTKLIRDCFAKRPRWHRHFTPTSSSWINQVERFFALLSEQQIKRSAHRSAADLEAAINTYIQARNADPKPFRWTKTSDDILAAIERFCRRTLAVHELPQDPGAASVPILKFLFNFCCWTSTISPE